MVRLLQYCVRHRVVGGGPIGPDAHRDLQPIRYWIGVLGLVIAAAFFCVCTLFFALASFA